MAKPKKLESYPEQDYPSLAEFTDRRGFLKRVVLGALAVGAGSTLVAGCVEFPGSKTAGDMPPPDYYDVRLPADGFASAYLTEGDYLTFAVTLITYDQVVADYLRQHEDEAHDALISVLTTRACAQLSDPESLVEVEEALRASLEEHVAERLPHSVQGIESLSLVVDVCEDGMIAGGDPGPDYP